MLKRLMQIVARSGTASTTELARALGVSPALVEEMLQALARRGYLRAVASGCGQPCAHCPVRAGCLFHRAPRIWALTAKGERLCSD